MKKERGFKRHRAASVFLRLGPAEVEFTQNSFAGGANIVLPATPRSDMRRGDFANNVVLHTLILRLFWKLPTGRLTEGGGAFTGRLQVYRFEAGWKSYTSRMGIRVEPDSAPG